MRGILLCLISSILTPATLASGQVKCLLAPQIKIETPLPAGEAKTDLTVISNSSGSCLARSVNVPLRPVGWQQAIAPRLVAKKPKLADVVEYLVSRFGWENDGQSALSLAKGAHRMNYGRSGGFNVAEGVDSGYASFPVDQDNAVVRF
jgi:hypothetical protein